MWVIDNLCPKGDALIRLEGLPCLPGRIRIAGMFILNTVMVRAIQILLEPASNPRLYERQPGWLLRVQ